MVKRVCPKFCQPCGWQARTAAEVQQLLEEPQAAAQTDAEADPFGLDSIMEQEYKPARYPSSGCPWLHLWQETQGCPR